MKRKFLIVVLAIASLLATYAISQTVTGQNWVGYVKVPAPPPGELKIIGVNFEAVGSEGGGIPLNELLNTNNLVGGPIPQNRDKVYIWDLERQGYETYTYNAGNFYQGGSTLTNPVVFAGQAMWFRSPTGAPADRDIYALGQVDLSSTVKVVFNEGLQLSSYPYPADMVFSNINWSGANTSPLPQHQDKIFLYENGSYNSYRLNSDGVWRNTDDGSEGLVLPAGSAFWYRSVSTYTNEFVRPFSID